jgi:hypothetical protein
VLLLSALEYIEQGGDSSSSNGSTALVGLDLIVDASRSHSVGHTTLGRTPLEEWTARRRDLYLTTHNTYKRQTSMFPAGFEPSIPASERPQNHFFFKGPAADATDAPQPWGLLCNPVMMMISFLFVFPCNGAPVEWNWQEKTKVLGEKPVAVPLCPPQIPYGLAHDRTRASAVRGRRLTAWAMARPRTTP